MTEPVLPPPPTPLKRNTKKQADPDYFKKYYQNKTKLIMIHCDIRNIDNEKSNFSRHKKTKRHINNENMIKYEELCKLIKQKWYEENYSEFD